MDHASAGGLTVRAALVLVALAALGCDAAGTSPAPSAPRPLAVATAPVATAPAPRGPTRPSPFLKGQLHAHTSGSGDSDTPPAEAAAWYAAHGYDFVVLTDHNRVTEIPSPPGMAVFRGVELTQNLRACEPPPGPREACLLHLNALFVGRSPQPITFDPPSSLARADLYGRALDRGLALGGVVQLNHPNSTAARASTSSSRWPGGGSRWWRSPTRPSTRATRGAGPASPPRRSGTPRSEPARTSSAPPPTTPTTTPTLTLCVPTARSPTPAIAAS